MGKKKGCNRQEEVLKVLRESPKPTTEIMKKLGEDTTESSIVSNFRKNVLRPLEERGLIFRLIRTETNKKILKDKFDIEWTIKKEGKRGHKSKKEIDKFHSYYINTEQARTKEFREFFDRLLNKFGDFVGLDKEEVNKRVNKIILLLSEFEFYNPKRQKFYAHKHLKNGKVEFFEVKHPIKRLSNKEIKDMDERAKEITREILKKKIKTYQDKKFLKLVFSPFKEKKEFMRWVSSEEQKEVDDSEIITFINKICDRIADYDSDYTAHLSGKILREINDLINSFDKQINFLNIANKIYKDMKKEENEHILNIKDKKNI